MENEKVNIKFKDYELSNEILEALECLEFSKPTRVQQEVMPYALKQKDIIVKSETGSGKTVAFGVPLCELIEWEENKPQALVLTPTRELAIQVKEELFNVGRFKRIKPVAVFGKSPFHIQQKELKQKTHIVVGTPGRLLDHMQRKTLDTSNIRYLVLDEADEMMDMGFIEQIQEIISYLPINRVTMLFSATMPEDIKKLCMQYMNRPITLEIENESKKKQRILQQKYYSPQAEKIDILIKLTIYINPESCIVFCNTKQYVDEVTQKLESLGYSVDKLHGGMEQDTRTKVMRHFKEGKFRYLVATDVAARGIDVEDISLVVNLDVPSDAETYTHRIGRTARKGKEGQAITIVDNSERKTMEKIEQITEMEVLEQEIPSEEEVLENKQAFEEKMKVRINKIDEKQELLNKDILKLHINAGKKTKMRPVDIVGTLCSIEGIEAKDIGIINVLDISTFVEVLNGKGEYVYKVLQDKKIKGRIRKVSKVDDKRKV